VLVVSTVLVFVLASLVFSMVRDTVYEAEALVTIQSEGELSSGQDAEAFVNEVFNDVDAQELRLETMKQAGWQGGEDSFERQRTIQAFARQDGGESGLLMKFSSSTAEEAARASNTYARLFVERVTQLNERLAGGSVAATASVQSRAALPEQPSSPRPVLYAMIAAGAGLLVGGAVALAIESRTQSWRGARDAELTLRAPVLGVIPEYPSEEGET
jgi:uncharacterized protein involved in exopolysaccharide biosynthesis